MTSPMSKSDIERMARDLRSGQRVVLSRAITLIESKRADHRRAAAALTQELLKDTGKAVRVGITGAPGVGKSTMIEALGSMLTAQDRKVAVLAVDPSSRRTGGSILADKTRMAKLANDEQRLHPALAGIRHARRRRRAHPRDHAALRGRGLRRDLGRDRRRRPIRSRGRRHDGLFSRAGAAGRRRRIAGAQERRRRTRRHDRGQQGRRRQSSPAPSSRRPNIPRRCISSAPARRTGRRRSSPVRRCPATASRSCGRTFSITGRGSPPRAN